MNKELQESIIAKKIGENSDKIDIKSLVDSSLTLPENLNIIKANNPALFGAEQEINIAELMQMEAKSVEEEQQNSLKEEVKRIKELPDVLDIHNLSRIKTIAIYGGTGTGKTALIFKILEELKESKRKVYFFRYPKPELLLKFGYNKIDTLEQIEQLRNMILVIDEPQLYFGIYDRKSNEIIAKLCSMSRQFNITLIIASSDTRVFTRHNESYFDLWLVKDLDYDMVKNGSKIKNIIRKNSLFDPSGFKLKNEEFISECRILSEFNGKHVFTLPEGFSAEISKPYY